MERTADPTLSDKNTLHPDSCQGKPAPRAQAGEAGEEPLRAPRPRAGWAAPAGVRAPAPRRSGTKDGPTRAGHAPRSATGTRLPEANEVYSLDPIKEPLRDCPRCSGGRSPHPSGAPSRAQETRDPTLRGVERGRPGLRNPGRGRRRGSGATTRPPSLLVRRGSLWLRAEERDPGVPASRQGSVRWLPLSPTHQRFGTIPFHSSLLPGVINGRVQTGRRPRQGLVGGSLRRPGSLGSEPEGELVGRTRPADRRGEERGGRKHTRGEPSCAPCDGPGIPPRGRLRRRLLQTAAGLAAARRPGRGRRRGAGPGRGGAVARATAPTAQRGRGRGRWRGGSAARAEVRAPSAVATAWAPPPRPLAPSRAAAAYAARRCRKPRRGGSEGAREAEGGAGAGPGWSGRRSIRGLQLWLLAGHRPSALLFAFPALW